MRINWKVRIRNPYFWVGLVGAIGAPVLAYAGIQASDITTWPALWGLIVGVFTNPYLLVLVLMAVLGVVTDQTTPGISDSERAMGSDEPRGDAE